MQYNSDSDNQDIVSAIKDKTATVGTSLGIKAITRSANYANRKIWAWIHDAYGGWLYDDSNNTSDFPSAKNTLTSGQDNYPIPSEALTIRFVSVRENNNGEWYNLKPITEELLNERQAEESFLSDNSTPTYYMPYGNSIKIFPASNYTQASSLRVSYDRGSTSFASTDTTKTPGFVSEFHDAVAVGAAADIARNKSLPNRRELVEDWQISEQEIKKFYQSRFQQMFPPKVEVGDYTRNMI